MLEKGSVMSDKGEVTVDQLERSSESLHVQQTSFQRMSRKLLDYGVETRGIHPVPVEQRTDSNCTRLFFIWSALGVSILPFSTGALGPLAFGLNARDSCLVILFFNILTSIPPAYIGTWGPKLGLRQMVHARYSFGYYGAIVPALLNALTLVGFAILSVILAGQTLASARSDGDISRSVGIVIISFVSFLLSLFGYKFISWFGRIMSALMCITLIIAFGLGGKQLEDPLIDVPVTASAVLSFGSAVAGFTLSLATLSMDYSFCMRPQIPSWRIFLFKFMGIFISVAAFMFLGAILAAASLANPNWQEGYMNGNVGGLLAAVLHPAGGFGQFLVVLLSVSLTNGVAACLYSTSLSFQTFLPILSRVPRVVFSGVMIAIVIPLGILASPKFQETLTNFLALIASWVAVFAAIIMVEHLVFRRSFSAYDLSHWDSPRKLPSGVSAIVAGVVGMGLSVPCINQVWYVGPIAEHTGDIGWEVACVASALVYVPLRILERRWFPRRSGL